MNIYQKLLQIQKHVSGLGKDKQGMGYQYVSGAKILSVVKPLMNELGLILKQELTELENSRQDYFVANKYAKENEPKERAKYEILSKCKFLFTWIDTETGEKDENTFYANGQNDWDKGVGSALTYAERYFLLKYFHIATDEDDIDNPDRNTTPPTPTPPPKTDSVLLKSLNTVGAKHYGKDWDTKRPELVTAITKGRTGSSRELTDNEAQRLINAINKLLEAKA